MERDIRRARDQWRGCYTFDDIICDGEGANAVPRRSGGLKMGCTYYYYYELDDGTEFHDTSLPSTTYCPYLPGQPVNHMYVPVEVEPTRYRSASLSEVANEHIKTLNPSDKFLSLRPPPRNLAMVQRSNTSPAPASTTSLAKTRSTRSLSPKSEKSPWSPKSIFSRRPSAPSPLETSDRGRAAPLEKTTEGDCNISYPLLLSHVGATRSDISPQTREASIRPSTPKRSSATQSFRSETTSHHASDVDIPDDIAEELEDDENFANQLSRFSLSESFTKLSPPPFSSARASPPISRSSLDKPLPEIPRSPLMPEPLRLVVPASELPRSHFSTSTISTTINSPTESNFCYSEGRSSMSEFDYDDYADMDTAPFKDGFSGYSLPDGEYESEQTLRKPSSRSVVDQRTLANLEGLESPAEVAERENALAQLMCEMQYLGDHIIGGK
ncbi:hypothetical protein BP5796_11602 [Coleophoma crateriformis]|uniref:Uncharacterized protein n=1 Tax=Coleophoma crateriformis TaxID=565419 RepID=A0A3D8QDT0_9HELO|nr:hypothetical protein BP5796_11602 [Coleophoma crateriformis]